MGADRQVSRLPGRLGRPVRRGRLHWRLLLDHYRMKLAPDATHGSRDTCHRQRNWDGELENSLFYFRHDLGTPELQSVAKVLEGEILTTGDAVSTSIALSPPPTTAPTT